MSVITSVYDPRFRCNRVASDAVVNNSTTLVNLVGSNFDVIANAYYIYEFVGRINASAAGDMKVAFVCTGSATASGMFLISTDTNGFVDGFIGGAAVPINTAGSEESMTIKMDIAVGADAGTIYLQFAQNVADVSDCKILADSMARIQRVF